MNLARDLAATIVLLIACRGTGADQGPANVASTLGIASMTSALFFCSLNDVKPLATAADGGGTRRPVLWAWSIDPPPPGLLKVLAVSSMNQPGCQAVQPLPVGGVDAVELHVPYAIIDKAADWSVGFTSIVIARKKADLAPVDFTLRLKRHVNLVFQLFESKGLDGYLVQFDGEVEWAYLHWPDLKTAKDAFATPDGATGPQDFYSFAEPFMPQTKVFPPP